MGAKAQAKPTFPVALSATKLLPQHRHQLQQVVAITWVWFENSHPARNSPESWLQWLELKQQNSPTSYETQTLRPILLAPEDSSPVSLISAQFIPDQKTGNKHTRTPLCRKERSWGKFSVLQCIPNCRHCRWLPYKEEVKLFPLFLPFIDSCSSSWLNPALPTLLSQEPRCKSGMVHPGNNFYCLTLSKL